MIKLLALTGQRRDEVASMRWRELILIEDKPIWSLPAERTKNGRAHDIPLAPACVAILSALPRVKDGHDEPKFVFTTTGRTSISGFSRAKILLDRQITAILKHEAELAGEDMSKVKPQPAWRFHDLRRTLASGCAQLAITLPVIEKILNHASGSFGGIVGVYQRHDFAEEKRQAMIKWAEFVEGLVQ